MSFAQKIESLIAERDALSVKVKTLEAELGRSEERYMAMHASATEWAGQRGVMAQWIGDALETLGTIEPESMDEGWQLRALIDSGRRRLGGDADDLLNVRGNAHLTAAQEVEDGRG